MSRALVIVGKAPRAGSTKTRLSPPLSAKEAAELYRAFVQDTAAMALGLAWEQVTLVYPPQPGAREELVAILPAGIHLQPQDGDGLGAALAGAFQRHLGAGFKRVVLIGSDNPTLPAAIVEAAGRGLENHDLVVGPSADGGYYSIGMCRPHLGIFERITWSTEVVYRETLERARDLALRVLPLPEWYDVDTEWELRRLVKELETLPLTVAPATRGVLARLKL